MKKNSYEKSYSWARLKDNAWVWQEKLGKKLEKVISVRMKNRFERDLHYTFSLGDVGDFHVITIDDQRTMPRS